MNAAEIAIAFARIWQKTSRLTVANKGFQSDAQLHAPSFGARL
jgi:hypothetical protein